jgi:hypothetical protein
MLRGSLIERTVRHRLTGLGLVEDGESLTNDFRIVQNPCWPVSRRRGVGQPVNSMT